MGYDRASYQKNKADALFRIAFHAEVVGRTEEAIRNYEKAIASYPDHCESHLQLSRIYEKMGLSDKAAQHRQGSKKSRAKEREVTERRPTIKRISYERYSAPATVTRSLEPMDFEEEDQEAARGSRRCFQTPGRHSSIASAL